jgi:hypothetical protein
MSYTRAYFQLVAKVAEALGECQDANALYEAMKINYLTSRKAEMPLEDQLVFYNRMQEQHAEARRLGNIYELLCIRLSQLETIAMVETTPPPQPPTTNPAAAQLNLRPGLTKDEIDLAIRYHSLTGSIPVCYKKHTTVSMKEIKTLEERLKNLKKH